MSTWIMHHGINGQRWGVRNGPPYPLSRQKRTPITYKNKRKLARKNLYEKEVFLNPNTAQDDIWGFKESVYYEDLSHDRLIKKGSYAYRTTSTKNETGSGGTFVSFDRSSANVYKKTFLEERKDPKNLYMDTYELTKDLKVPSTKVMAEVMIDEILANKKTFKKYLKEYYSRMSFSDSDIDKKYKKNIDRFISDPNRGLVDFYVSILRSSNSDLGLLGENIHKKLKDKGYDAVPDMNDTSDILKTAFYIFDRSSLNLVEQAHMYTNWNYTFPEERYKVKYVDGTKRRSKGVS